MAEECGSCRFSYGRRDEWSGNIKCRRYPPNNTKHGLGGLVASWPEVSMRDWCGEYQPSPTTAGERADT